MSQNYMESLKGNATCAFSSDFSLQEEALYLDILKNLYSETVDLKTKLDSLYILQQESRFLLSSSDKVEQVFGSLHSVFNELFPSNQQYFCGQILVSMTVVLLTSVDLKPNAELDALISKHRDLLLSVTETKNKPVVNVIAWQCLEEIEVLLPGLFSESSIEQIYRSCRRSKTPNVSLPTCACLLGTIAKNSDLSTRSAGNELPKFESNNVSPASPFPQTDFVSLSWSLVDLWSALTPPTLQRNMHSVTALLQNQNRQMLSSTLKLWLPKLTHSSDLLLLHESLIIYANFYEDSMSSMLDVLNHFSQIINHPSLPIVHRLLIMDWFETLLSKESLASNNKTQNLETMTSLWFPRVFDGTDICTKKLRVLVSYLPPENLSNIILPIFSSLRKLIHSSRRSKILVFQTIFFMWQKLEGNRSFENHICMFVSSLLEQYLPMLKYLLDFIRAVKKQNSKSWLCENLLDAVVARMDSLSQENESQHIDWLLLSLNHANKLGEPTTRIKSFLDSLDHLLENSPNLKQSWIIGHQVLSTFTQLLKRSDMSLLYWTLGRILHSFMVSSSSHRVDVDVVSRAKYCYAALTSLTPTKVSQLFVSQRTSSKPMSSVTGSSGNSVFSLVPPILEADVSYLKVLRANCDFSENGIIFQGSELSDYLTWLGMNKQTIPLCLRLLYESKPSDYKVSEIYGLKIKVHVKDANCSILPFSKVPSLTYGGEQKISFSVVPLKSVPMQLKFTIEFTIENGESFVGQLPYVLDLKLEDLFCSFPCVAKKTLYDELWKYIVEKSPKNQSVQTLQVRNSKLRERWKNFCIEDYNTSKWGILVPPTSHLLLRHDGSTEHGIQLLFASDNSQLFPWFQNYLRELEE